jgi:hypothetical protein
VFRPQYNIKRSLASRDVEYFNSKKQIMQVATRVKYLLDKCLDPNELRYNLIMFKYIKPVKGKRFYRLVASTPKKAIDANSIG